MKSFNHPRLRIPLILSLAGLSCVVSANENLPSTGSSSTATENRSSVWFPYSQVKTIEPNIFIDNESQGYDFHHFPLSHLGRVIGDVSVLIKTNDKAEEEIIAVKTADVLKLLPKLKAHYRPKSELIKNGQGNFHFNFNDSYEIVTSVPNEYFKSTKVQKIVKAYQRPRLTHDIHSNISRVVATYNQNKISGSEAVDLTVSSKTRWNRNVAWTYLSTNENIRTKANIKYEGGKLDYYAGALNSSLYANLPNVNFNGAAISNRNTIGFKRYQAFNKSIELDADSTIRVYINDQLESSASYAKGIHVFNLPYSSSQKEVRLEVENEYGQVFKIDFEAPGYNTADDFLFEFGAGQLEEVDRKVVYGSISEGGFELGAIAGNNFLNVGAEQQIAIDDSLFTEIEAGYSKNSTTSGYKVGGSINKRLDGAFFGVNAFLYEDFSQLGQTAFDRFQVNLNLNKNLTSDINLSGSLSLTDKLSRQSLRARYSPNNSSTFSFAFNNSGSTKSYNLSYIYRFDELVSNSNYSSENGFSNTTNYRLNDDNRLSLSVDEMAFQNSTVERKNAYANISLSTSK